MKKLFSVLLAVCMILCGTVMNSTATQAAETADSGDIRVTVATDKGSYGLLDTATVTVTVTNNTIYDLKDAEIFVSSSDYNLVPGSKSSADVNDIEKGESVQMTFQGYVSPLSASGNILSRFVCLFKRLFAGKGSYDTFSLVGRASKTDSFSVKHGLVNANFSVSVLYDRVEQVVKMGSYPRTKVKDAALISSLSQQPAQWKSFGYYSGSGKDYDGKMAAADYMRYTDVTFGGEKYRGIVFDSYRPYSNCYPADKDPYQSGIDDFGYYLNNTYWFKYETLTWNVLDIDTGLALCNEIIDSQPFHNFVLEKAGKVFGNANMTAYAANYNESSLRSWLNKDFYNTAFNDSEKLKIKNTFIESKSIGTVLVGDGYSSLDCAGVTDKIFLLSFADIINPAYGFNGDFEYKDGAKRMTGTDYAHCQGLCIYDVKQSDYAGYEGCYSWWLRSAFSDTYLTSIVSFSGHGNYAYSVDDTFVGVVPAMCIVL